MLRVFTPARPGSRASLGQEASAWPGLARERSRSAVLGIFESLRLGHQHTVGLESSKPRRLHQARESRREILLAAAGDVPGQCLLPQYFPPPFADDCIALCLCCAVRVDNLAKAIDHVPAGSCHSRAVPLFSTPVRALFEELLHLEVALCHLVRHFLLMSDAMGQHVTAASAHDVVKAGQGTLRKSPPCDRSFSGPCATRILTAKKGVCHHKAGQCRFCQASLHKKLKHGHAWA